jgi:NADH:quinone reductase (non-electrogenic)
MRTGRATQPTVIIVGGGFAGLYAAKALANQPVRVILIDRKNHHTFQPLLYQVALAMLTPADIASPLRHILRDAQNTETILGEVVGFNTAARRVRLATGQQLDYDYLIVAAGSRHAYFGHPEWERVAPGLKTIEDAVEIRRRLLLAFEQAERKALLTGERQTPAFSVVGGGPTGVELAGAIADLARLGLAKDFKAIDTRDALVRLYEGGPRILPTFSEQSSQRALRQLEELGVEVHNNTLVTGVEPGRIKAGNEWAPSDVTLWASGVAASPLGKLLSDKTDRSGRVAVEPDLTLPGHPEIFVLGDMSILTDAGGVRVPGLAAAATQEGRAAAQNILRDLRGATRVPFGYRDRGTMATIGHARAVAEFGGGKLSGLTAWLLWSVIHVFLLIGFRNRLDVMRQWLWAYLTRSGASPLITEYETAEAKEAKAAHHP